MSNEIYLAQIEAPVADLLISEHLPGDFNPCICGYPVYYTYNIVPESGWGEEREWFEPISVVKSEEYTPLEQCPNCLRYLTST